MVKGRKGGKGKGSFFGLLGFWLRGIARAGRRLTGLLVGVGKPQLIREW